MLAMAAAPRTPQAASSAALCDLLADLYARQLAAGSPDQFYLEEHARTLAIRGQVEMFHRYLPYLRRGGAVLDWGCNHAPDSCLFRAACGDAYDLYGCDFPAAGAYGVFHDFAGLEYRSLEGLVRMPFEDNQFDAVIGSGTLEHTAMDYESLKEVHRVLKPGGVFVASYLPNWLSKEEFLRRLLNKPHHLRRYKLAETRSLFLHTGFNPLRVDYQHWGWEKQAAWLFPNQRFAARLAACLRAASLISIRCSTLFAVGRKMVCM